MLPVNVISPLDVYRLIVEVHNRPLRQYSLRNFGIPRLNLNQDNIRDVVLGSLGDMFFNLDGDSFSLSYEAKAKVIRSIGGQIRNRLAAGGLYINNAVYGYSP